MNLKATSIRDCAALDYADILRLNLESEHFLSPLSLSKLQSLHAQAWYCKVICQDHAVRGFLLVMREGAQYESVNYRWFAARFSEFVYIDRIAVDAATRGQNFARHLYEDLFAYVRVNRLTRITCEYDTDPPNEASRRFHQRLGFHEIGSQRTADGKKTVSLQELLL